VFMACGLRIRTVLRGALMQFILGVIFFVVVVGLLDARLPWPRPRPNKGMR
jgi:hypothetical protein